MMAYTVESRTDLCLASGSRALFRLRISTFLDRGRRRRRESDLSLPRRAHRFCCPEESATERRSYLLDIALVEMCASV